MSVGGDTLRRDHDRIAVFDTSALIEVKTAIAAQRQGEFFEIMQARVQQGQVYFPKAVREESRGHEHHDTPETWAFNVYGHMRGTAEPTTAAVLEVMKAAAAVVEADAEGDPPRSVRTGPSVLVRTYGRRPWSFRNPVGWSAL